MIQPTRLFVGGSEVSDSNKMPVSGPATNAEVVAALLTLQEAITGAGVAAKTLADIVTKLNAGLPAALAANGGLKVEGVAGGVAQPVSNSVIDDDVSEAVVTDVAAKWPKYLRGLIKLIINTITTKDGGPSWTSSWGTDADGTPVTSADMSAAAVDCTVAPTSTQKLVIDDVLVSADTAMRVVFTEETSNKVRFYVRVPANGQAQITLRGKMKLLAADKKLRCQASVAGNVEVLVGYHSEA